MHVFGVYYSFNALSVVRYATGSHPAWPVKIFWTLAVYWAPYTVVDYRYFLLSKKYRYYRYFLLISNTYLITTLTLLNPTSHK